MSPDVVVIGGGAVGCACAFELVKRGAKVTVIERDGIASHASGFSLGGLFPTQGAGIPGPVEAPARDSYDIHTRLYGELMDETGIDYQLRQVDQVSLATNDASRSALLEAYRWQRSRGFDAAMLSERDLRLLEPSLSPEITSGLLLRSGMELNSYKYTLALAQATEKRGGHILSAEATGIAVRRGKVEGVATRSGATVRTSAVVIASGPWAGLPPDSSHLPTSVVPLPLLPVKPIKGEILRVRMPGTGFAQRFTFDGRSVGRKPDGLVWIAATEQDRGFDEQPSAGGRDFLMAGAALISPTLSSAELVEHTTCLRPLTSDSLPLVGRMGMAEGVYAAAGAGKKGVLLSVVIAKWVAAIISGRPGDATVPPELSTSRFGL